jgi:hypothetical protein
MTIFVNIFDLFWISVIAICIVAIGVIIIRSKIKKWWKTKRKQ